MDFEGGAFEGFEGGAEEAEEDRGEDDAERGEASEEGDGDAGEAEAVGADVWEEDVGGDAGDLQATGEPGECAGEGKGGEGEARDIHAGEAGGVGILSDDAEAKAEGAGVGQARVAHHQDATVQRGATAVGVRPGEGLHGHWVQARYVNLFVTDAGGRVFADVGEEKVTLAATIPA